MRPQPMPSPRRRALASILGLTVASFILMASPLGAAPPGDDPPQDQDCLTCHGNADLSTVLPSGETLPLFIDASVFDGSVHGQLGLTCTNCHTDIADYPHPPLTSSDRRGLSLDKYTQCRNCHEDRYELTLDSVHGRALAAGTREAAICTDCHGAHDVAPPDEPRERISITCSQCHSAIFDTYRESVHGAALLEESNPDVPTCVDCHGVHTIEDPQTAAFRLRSPNICGTCHADPALMEGYGISTDVFDTYVADFHGTTVTLFEKQSPDQITNKAVCFDCHGVHDIRATDDPEASVIRANLLETCRQCHPDAEANFPAAWTSHYRPTSEQHPLVYYVNLFYRLFIPSVIGSFVVLIGLDGGRRLRDQLRGRTDG